MLTSSIRCIPLPSGAPAPAMFTVMQSLLVHPAGVIADRQEPFLIEVQGFIVEPDQLEFAIICNGAIQVSNASDFASERLTTCCQSLLLSCEKKELRFADLLGAQEAICLDGSDHLTPILRVEGQWIGNGRIGPWMQALQETIRQNRHVTDVLSRRAA